MHVKKLLLLILLTMSFGLKIEAQNIKYVIVPIQFDFLKGKDQFRANTLLRHLFKENGYEAYFDVEELPDELFKDRCKAMYSNVIEIDGGLSIKVQIEIKDCRGDLLFISDIGKTKEKDFNKGYKIAIRKAFESFKTVDINAKNDTVEQSITEENNEGAKQKSATNLKEILLK